MSSSLSCTQMPGEFSHDFYGYLRLISGGSRATLDSYHRSELDEEKNWFKTPREEKRPSCRRLRAVKFSFIIMIYDASDSSYFMFTAKQSKNIY